MDISLEACFLMTLFLSGIQASSVKMILSAKTIELGQKWTASCVVSLIETDSVVVLNLYKLHGDNQDDVHIGTTTGTSHTVFASASLERRATLLWRDSDTALVFTIESFQTEDEGGYKCSLVTRYTSKLEDGDAVVLDQINGSYWGLAACIFVLFVFGMFIVKNSKVGAFPSTVAESTRRQLEKNMERLRDWEEENAKALFERNISDSSTLMT